MQPYVHHITRRPSGQGAEGVRLGTTIISAHHDRASIVVGPQGLHLARSVQQAGAHSAGRRGLISGFSASSRRRFTRALLIVDFTPSSTARAWFVSITGDDTLDYADFAKFQVALFQRLRRDARVRGWYWRRQWEQRKSGEYEGEWRPHLHLAAWCRPTCDVEEVQGIFKRCWLEVTGTQHPWAHRYSVDVKPVEAGLGLMAYCCRYMARVQNRIVDGDTGEIIATGRCWGRCGDVPTAVIQGWVGYRDYCVFMRRLRRWRRESVYLRGRSGGDLGVTVYGDGVDMLVLMRDLESVTWGGP